MRVPFHTVMAFSAESLSGNPACIVMLDHELDQQTMQRISAINSFPETVFLRRREGDAKSFDIKWFTPLREVYDAGHATLAAQYVIANEYLSSDVNQFELLWNSSRRIVDRDSVDTLFYSSDTVFSKVDEHHFSEGDSFVQAFQAGDDLVFVLPNVNAVRTYKVDLDRLAQTNYRGLAITSQDNQFDYCNRFFAPRYGVNEDFVTATAHAYLSAYWGEVLNKNVLSGIQYSGSPGIVNASLAGNGVTLVGKCCLYKSGYIYL